MICGGWPCQDLSVAGRRAGLIEGKRSSLFFEAMRIIKELQDAGVGPTFAVFENVPGLLSSNGGNDFAVVLAELANLGAVDIAWRVLDSQFFGVAQRRRRVFIVADFGAERAAEILALSEGLYGYPAPSREAGEGVAGDAIPSLAASGRGTARAGESRGQDPLVLAPTLNAYAGGNQIEGAYTVAMPITAPEGKGPNSDCDSGNLIAHTLRAEGFDASEDGTGRGTPIVTTAVCAKWAKGTSGPAGDEVANIIAFDTTQVTSKANRSNPKPGGPCHPLAAGARAPAVMNLRGREGGAMPEMDDLASLRAASGGSSRSYAITAIPRRLTPTECERLQNWPDGHTAWGLDEDGKRVNMADGPRYRMAGNGVTASVVEWIGRRIMSARERTP